MNKFDTMTNIVVFLITANNRLFKSVSCSNCFPAFMNDTTKYRFSNNNTTLAMLTIDSDLCVEHITFANIKKSEYNTMIEDRNIIVVLDNLNLVP